VVRLVRPLSLFDQLLHLGAMIPVVIITDNFLSPCSSCKSSRSILQCCGFIFTSNKIYSGHFVVFTSLSNSVLNKTYSQV
jgi:hypothetical protein